MRVRCATCKRAVPEEDLAMTIVPVCKTCWHEEFPNEPTPREQAALTIGRAIETGLENWAKKSDAGSDT